MKETKFKFIDDVNPCHVRDRKIQVEIAYQLKRIADILTQRKG